MRVGRLVSAFASSALLIVLLTAGLAQPGSSEPAAVRAAGTVTALPRVLYRVPTSDPVFFITIDDGWYKSAEAARYVEAHRVPVTVFLTNDAVQGRWSYFARMARRGTVQNHTLHHPPLARLSVNRTKEICGASGSFAARYGTRPWMLRPPYGDGWYSRRSGAPLVRRAAAACGIQYIVLWNVVVEKWGEIGFTGERRYQPGDIVLMHFDSNLGANIAALVSRYRAHGLRPARLETYLPRLQQ